MWRKTRPSLPQALTYAVAKAVVTTLAVLSAYVGGSVAADMSLLAEGRRSTPSQDISSSDLSDINITVFRQPVD